MAGIVTLASAAELTITPSGGLTKTVVYGDTSAAAATQNILVTNTTSNTVYFPVTYYFGTQGATFYSVDTYPPVLGANGTASLNVTIPTTSYSLTPGTYSGAIDGGDAGRLSLGLIASSPVTLIVTKGNTSTSVSSSSPTSVGSQSVTFTATVSAISPASGTLGGNVTFMDGNTVLGSAVNLSNGQATYTTSALTVAGHSITAVYSGDSNFNGSTSGAFSQTVNSASATVSVSALPSSGVTGQSITITATVTKIAPATATPGGSVTFSVDGNQTTVSLSNGTASISTSTLSVSGHTVSVNYTGDTNFASASGSLSGGIVVSKGSTGSSVTSSGSPSVFGQSVTFTATVSVASPASGTPTGTVIFSIDGVPQPSVNLSGGGTATFAAPGLSGGAHLITATYSGDGRFNGSTSASFSQTVNKATTALTTASSLAPTIYGSPATFTARVVGGTPAPSGSVSFADAANVLGTPTLSTIGQGQTVAVGSFHACAITSAGAVQCWGGNANGQLGDGTLTSHASPQAAQVVTSGIVAVTAGASHTCALNNAGAVSCWGLNNFGQLGDSTVTSRTSPVGVTGLTSGIVAIAAGTNYTCALSNAGIVQCWGTNNAGQLGDGSTTTRLSPVTVAALTGGVTAISAGTTHSCALTTAGGAKCWGSNGSGELGNATNTASGSPVDVSGLTSGVAAISAGNGFTCATLSTGTAKCWGGNLSGQLGNGSVTTSNAPVDVTGIANAAIVVASNKSYSTCALDRTGAATCWGDNTGGQLGDGTVIERHTPVAVTGLSSGVNVAVGNYNSCLQDRAGGINCWGTNTNGQLGDGTTTARLAPGADIPSLATLGVSTASLTTSALATGGHTIAASYAGDTNFTASAGNVAQSVTPATTATALVPSSPTVAFGQLVTLTATVSSSAGTPVGNVAFMEGANTLATLGLDGSGMATFQTSAFAPGNHTITAVYLGNTNFSTSTSGGVVETVNQATTTVAISNIQPAQSTFGQAVTITASISIALGAGTPSGTLTFKDGNATIGSMGPDGSGTASLTTTTLAVGAHNLSVVYSGDTNFAGATSSVATYGVSQAAVAVALGASPSGNSVYGQTVMLTATVTSGVGTPSGTATFKDGGTTLGTVGLVAGSASFNASALAVGSHNLTVDYSGDLTFTGGNSGVLTQSVGRAATTTSLLVGTQSSVFGQSVSLTATVATTSPGTGTAAGVVSFFDGATLLGTGTLTGGSATFATTSLAVGNHSLTASFATTGNYSGSTSAASSQTVSKGITTSAVSAAPASSVTGQQVTFTTTITVSSPAAGTPTGTVIYTIDGAVQPAVAVSAGTAILSRSALAVGAHTVSAAYSGDSNFNASSGSLTGGQTVAKGSTSVNLRTSAASVAAGQSVTFTATVAATAPATGTPTGLVTFKDGSTTLGTGNLASGVATFATTTLTSGSHTITAVYAGDTGFITSTSTGLAQAITKSATTLALASSANPAPAGQSITLSATLTTSAGTPTGAVTFKDDTTVLGTGTLASGVATFAATLNAGAHRLTATYDGDVNYASSTSAVLVETLILSCNDSFALATALSGASGNVSGNNASATGEPGEPNHAAASTPLNSLWCKWTAPAAGPVVMDTTGSDFDTTLAVYTGSGFSALTPVAANDNISASVKQSRVSFSATAGTQYLVAVDGAGAATGNYLLNWSQASASTLMAAVLPTSRSVVTGTQATAFATIINSGSSAAHQCGLSLPTGFPGTFTYQTTTSINTTLGSADSSIDIPTGAAQGFVFGITPTINMDANEVAIVFSCADAAPATSVPGLNTLNLSASPVPTPDLIAIGATLTKDGIVTVPVGGASAFSAAAVNIGAAGTIMALVDDNGTNLPLTLTLCRSDPSTGACTTAPSSSTTFTAATNDVVTFSLFVQANGAVPFDPAHNRLFLRLETPDGVTRGATSVAVRTQ